MVRFSVSQICRQTRTWACSQLQQILAQVTVVVVQVTVVVADVVAVQDPEGLDRPPGQGRLPRAEEGQVRRVRRRLVGDRGLVGSAIVRRLQAGGWRNLLLRTHAELDLGDAAATRAFNRTLRRTVQVDPELTALYNRA